MKLTEIMKLKGISSIQLSEMTGIKKMTIENYRQERREPSFSNGLKIADALGIDPHELLEPADMKIYTASRESGDFIEEVATIEEAKKLIAKYEEHDKSEGVFEEDFYDIVDGNHISLL